MSAEPNSEPKAPTEKEVKDASKSKDKTQPNKFKKFLSKLWSTKKRRVITIVVTAVVILAALFAIPFTRYAIAGIVVKKSTTITINDSVSGKPVSEVTVMLAGHTAITNAKGEAKFSSIPVGDYQLKVEKKYYQGQQQSYRIPILSNSSNTKLTIKATGRAVLVKVLNKISGSPLEKAKVSASDTTAVTGKNGEASIVLPISTKLQKAKVEAEGFNVSDIELTVTSADNQKYESALTPAGKIYFLSKRTGKINVMKSDLDGSNVQVVLTGTGRENEYDTILLATRDWKYLALKSAREDGKPKVFLVNTSTDEVSVIDLGADVDFTLDGWLDHNFVYRVIRHKSLTVDGQAYDQTVLKTFDAESGKLTTIDQTEAKLTNHDSGLGVVYKFPVGTAFDGVYLTSKRIVYTKYWQDWYPGTLHLQGNTSSIYSTDPSGSNKKTLKIFDAAAYHYFTSRSAAPGEIYYEVSGRTETYGVNKKPIYFEYEDDKVADAKLTSEEFNKFYPTFIQSPSGDRTFWYEPRDGKNTLFSGNNEGRNGKELASLSEFVPYGWYSDDYVLVSKKGSELYIAPSDFSTAPVKVADYHKPNFNGQGYGGGYGGY